MRNELNLSILDASKNKAIVLAQRHGDIAISHCSCGTPLKKLTETRERISKAIEGEAGSA